MQILPTTASTASSTLTDSSQSKGRDEFDFSRLVSEVMQDAPAEITPNLGQTSTSGSSIPLDSNAHTGTYAQSDSNVHSDAQNDEKPVGEDDPFVSDAPYTQTDQYNSDYTEQEVRFTDSEMQKVAEALKKAGIDQEIINQMLKLAGNPMGVTAQEMVRSMLQVVRKPAQLSDTDLMNIQSFAQRIDPSGKLGEGLLDDVRSGRTLQGWQRVLDALHAADQGATLKVDRNELVSLGKGLGLSDATLASLRGAMGQNRQANMTPAMLEAMMAPAQHELGERKMQLDKLASAINSALSPAMQEAKRRMADEQAASARSIRSVDQSQYLIKDTVTRKGLAQTQPDTSAETPLTAQRLEAMLRAGSSDGQNAPKGGEYTGSDTKNGADAESFSARKGKGKWDALNERLRTDTGSIATQSLWNQASTPVSAGMAGLQPGQLPGQLFGQTAGTTAPHVLRQVEQGLFTAMRNGAQRLELQLAPAELGTVTVVLTLKNGEISASLRPERGETATLLAQQADVLRTSLEQQGLKVDKVEVQTQLQDQRQGANWQGMDQHNMTRDQQARSEEQERMLRLGRIGRLNRQGSSAEVLPEELLDRNMHSSRGTAGVAGGLHIVT